MSLPRCCGGFLALSGLTTAIFWGTTRPVWLIQDSNQINVSGNKLLSDQTIQDLLPIDYPQPLLKVEPEQLAEQLHNRAPLVSVDISRQLLPPPVERTGSGAAPRSRCFTGQRNQHYCQGS